MGTASGPAVAGQPAAAVPGCACGQIDCGAPGAYPLPEWWFAATADTATLRWWWTRVPQAPIMAPTGRSFDVLDVPLAAGRQALSRLHELGAPAGPVLRTRSGRALLLVSAGISFELPGLLAAAGVPSDPTAVGGPDLLCHGRDGYVALPTFRAARNGLVSWETRPGSPVPDRAVSRALVAILAGAPVDSLGGYGSTNGSGSGSANGTAATAA
jgi:hypothetical protein